MLELLAAEAARPGSHLNVQEPSFYHRFFGGDGDALTAWDGPRLLGFALLGHRPFVHALWDPYLRELGASPDSVGVCIHMLVRPEHRGKGLGRRLHAMRMLHALHRGLEHLVATTHPDNRPVLHTLRETGFVELDRRVVYEARVPRVLLHRALRRPTLEAPRVRLCRLPTPIEPLARLTAAIGGPELFIKRDDTVGLATGGNKSRMLEYLVADAMGRGARTLVTCGHQLSNHCRQTAAAAAALGLGCRLVLKGSPPDSPRGNVLLDQLLGARITWTEGRDANEVLDEVVAQAELAGEAPYRISYGGALALGAAAYAEAFAELADAGERFDRIFVAASSGATQAGLVAGAVLEGSHTHVVGVSVDEDRPTVQRSVARLASEVGRCYGLGPLPIEPDDIEVDTRMRGPGYGVVGPAEREALALFARTEGILLDPVYTARAAAGMLAQCRRGELTKRERVLFVHTGGLPSLFAMSEPLMAGEG